MTRRLFTVGLTGGIGAGKSTVAELFEGLSVPVIDTDAIAHALTAPGGAAIPAIRAQFGAAALTAEGSLDRPAMRARAFGDPAARAQLEAILHPMIRAQVTQQRAALAESAAPYVLIAVPLLIERAGWREQCDRILVVDCPTELQRSRVMQRSGLNAAQVEAILQAQADRATRLAAADDVIDNSGPSAALGTQVMALHRQYEGLSRTPE
jgi:dephospho-CoA kinase